jgi:hypothetical protein
VPCASRLRTRSAHRATACFRVCIAVSRRAHLCGIERHRKAWRRKSKIGGGGSVGIELKRRRRPIEEDESPSAWRQSGMVAKIEMASRIVP